MHRSDYSVCVCAATASTVQYARLLLRQRAHKHTLALSIHCWAADKPEEE